METKYELGSCIKLQDGSSWCVFAIDSNKQEYRLGGIIANVNHGKEIIKPIDEVDSQAESLGFRFPHNGIDESESGVQKVIKEKPKLPNSNSFLGR